LAKINTDKSGGLAKQFFDRTVFCGLGADIAAKQA
jgi:hypothetical protein